MQKKLYIYQTHIAEVGGCETFLYNLSKQLNDYYDLKIIYEFGSPYQIKRIMEFVDIEKIDYNKTYECDILIQNSLWNSIFKNVKSTDKRKKKPRVIGMVHTDYTKLTSHIEIDFDYIDEFIGCGDNASITFTQKYGVKCTSIKNILDTLQPTQEIFHFISAGRLTADKGWGRMEIMINMLRKENILFDWTIFTDTDMSCDYEEVRFMKPRYEIWSYLKDATYGVLLSNAEGNPLFVNECFQYDTPVIGTDTSGIKDLVINNKNGYLVPLDMNFDINIIKKIPKIKNYNNGTTIKDWCDYLGDSEYIPREKRKEEILIKAVSNEEFDYFDFENINKIERSNVRNNIKGVIFKSDVLILNEKQFEYLSSSNLNNARKKLVTFLEFI